MQLLNKQRLLGAVFLGAAAIASFAQVESAQAFSWTSTTATFQPGDLAGTDFTVFFFDGYIDEVLTPGLTSEAKFTLLDNFNSNSNFANFGVTVTNTSDSSIFDRVRISGLGFNTDPELDKATITNQGSGFKINAFLNSNVPQPPITGGKVDVCFTPGNNCAGGGGKGIEIDQSYSFQTRLDFKTLFGDSLKLDNFVVRYQSIDFKNSPKGESGVGVGTVPTPAMLPGLIGMGIAAWRKKKQQAEAEASSSLA